MKHEIVTGLWRAWSHLYDVKYRADRLQITRKQVGSAISSLLLSMALCLLTSILKWMCWQQAHPRPSVSDLMMKNLVNYFIL